MARKQNKSSGPAKKATSVSVNTKKGGKVQKNKVGSKSNKTIKSQLKQAESSPVNTSRRSSRKSIASNSTTPVKKTTTTKAILKTGGKQSPSKRKSNSSEQNKKSPKINKSSKIEPLPSGNKKSGTKTHATKRKRSFAQSVSDGETEPNTETKKRKTNDAKKISSRGSRNIKPTIKGSEWQKTILQKKSTADKTSKNTLPKEDKKIKTPRKNELPKENKKSPAKSNVKVGKGANKTVSPSPKRQTKVQSKITKKPSPTKKNVKTPVQNNSTPSKSQKASGSSRRSNSRLKEDTSDSHEANTLATAIKNKFNSCFSKRRSCKMQESVLVRNLVVEGILNDIVGSIGKPDTLNTDDVVSNSSQNDGTTVLDSEISSLNAGGNNEANESKTNNPPTQTATAPISESLSNLVGNEENLTTEDVQTSNEIKTNDGLLNKTDAETGQNIFDESVEDMDLRLDSSPSSLNGSNHISTGNTTTESPKSILKLTNSSNADLEDDSKTVETQLTSQTQNEESSIVNGKCINEIEDTSRINDNPDKCLPKDIKDIEGLEDKNISISRSECKDLGTVIDSIEPKKNMNKKIILEKEDNLESNVHTTQDISKCSDSVTSLNGLENCNDSDLKVNNQSIDVIHEKDTADSKSNDVSKITIKSESNGLTEEDSAKFNHEEMLTEDNGAELNIDEKFSENELTMHSEEKNTTLNEKPRNCQNGVANKVLDPSESASSITNDSDVQVSKHKNVTPTLEVNTNQPMIPASPTNVISTEDIPTGNSSTRHEFNSLSGIESKEINAHSAQSINSLPHQNDSNVHLKSESLDSEDKVDFEKSLTSHLIKVSSRDEQVDDKDNENVQIAETDSIESKVSTGPVISLSTEEISSCPKAQNNLPQGDIYEVTGKSGSTFEVSKNDNEKDLLKHSPEKHNGQQQLIDQLV